MRHAHCWIVTLEQGAGDVPWNALVTSCGTTTNGEPESYEFSGSSKELFQELLTVLDASIFTSLAIAEGLLSPGQQPLG